MLYRSLCLCFLLNFSLHAERIASVNFEKNIGGKVLPTISSKVELQKDSQNNGGVLQAAIHTAGKYSSSREMIWRSWVFPLTPGRYALRAKVKALQGYGMQLHLVGLDKNGKRVTSVFCSVDSAPRENGKWMLLENFLTIWDPACVKGILELRVAQWVQQKFLLDDIEVISLPITNQRRYKAEFPVTVSSPLVPPTAADIPGPDGFYYPDFSYAGCRSGKNALSGKKLPVIKLDVKSGDIIDNSLNDALKKCKTGGIIQLPPGKFKLKQMLWITQNDIVLQGAGKDYTEISLDYDMPADSPVDLCGLKNTDALAPGSMFHLVTHRRNSQRDLASLSVEFNGKILKKFQRQLHSGGISWLTAKIPADCPDGEYSLVIKIVYQGATPQTVHRKIRIDRTSGVTLPAKLPEGIISFYGKGISGKAIRLVKDASRGSKILELKNPAPFKSGDVILLRAAETPEFRQRIGNTCKWGISRNVLLTVAKTDGNIIHLDQPVRVTFPVSDRAEVLPYSPLRGGGVSGISFETKNDFWFHTLSFLNVADCVVNDVRIIKSGRNPLDFTMAKFCTVSDSEFREAWNYKGGKSAYLCLEKSYDCLIERVRTSKLRHAPAIQWSSSGNVVRDSFFHNSDAQWHAGYTHENLFENLKITSDTKQYGSYGHGFFATGPGDNAHGPNGPRNVVWHCDADVFDAGVKLTGNNENWMFLYNRFVARRGHGIRLEDNAADTVIFRNHIFCSKPGKALLVIAGTDSPGLFFVGNTVAGRDARLQFGTIAPEFEKENKILHADAPQGVPEPPVPSLYLYQKNLKTTGKKTPSGN